MNFDFSDDQKTIRDQANTFLSRECPPAAVRQVLEGDAHYHRELWRQIVDLGWPATTVAEEHGGLGLGYLELCVIAQEMGRALAPVPFIASVYLATEAVKLMAGAEQQAEWLPALAGGAWIGTLAAGDDCELRDGRLYGVCRPVLHGAIADRAVVVARDGGGRRACLVELDAEGVTRRPLESIDPTQPLAELTFDGAPAIVLEGEADIDGALATLYDRAAVLLAFEQVGGCDATIEMAKEYTCNRYAFGRQIASFQAIKHKLADMFVAAELARSNAYYGAWALSAGSGELPLAAATARVSATDAYYQCSKENIQAHGGMGFTWEFDCHLYYRRAQALSLMLGGNPRWQNLLVERLLGGEAA